MQTPPCIDCHVWPAGLLGFSLYMRVCVLSVQLLGPCKALARTQRRVIDGQCMAFRVTGDWQINSPLWWSSGCTWEASKPRDCFLQTLNLGTHWRISACFWWGFLSCITHFVVRLNFSLSVLHAVYRGGPVVCSWNASFWHVSWPENLHSWFSNISFFFSYSTCS